LVREDPEVSQAVLEGLQADGVQVLLGHKALECGIDAQGKWIEVDTGGASRRIHFDEILVAVGRVARLSGYGLQELGIPTGRVIETNEYLETLYPNIFAVGDVAGPFQFTHAAAHQAWYAAVNALFGDFRKFRADYRVIPAATFTAPEVARVGLNEAEAKAQGIAHEVTPLWP
jgi:pyruvate/2-oxoglutarate dehydrogenase complex dihydrolipoamide dehydrogenase (E3) component